MLPPSEYSSARGSAGAGKVMASVLLGGLLSVLQAVPSLAGTEFSPSSVKKGVLLVASPSLEDPNFRQAVLLVVEHGPEGTMMPAEYRPFSISGSLRDLASEVTDLLNKRNSSDIKSFSDDFGDRVARIRREVRIEIHRKLSDNHPACKNLEEIIVRYQSRDNNERVKWLSEFTAATWEAAQCIEYQVS